MRADDRADVVDLDARDVQAAADLLSQEFRVCKAVTVADEDGLLSGSMALLSMRSTSARMEFLRPRAFETLMRWPSLST